MNINDLVSACDNEGNTRLLSLTNEKIMKEKVQIISELPVSQEDKVEIIEKLTGYMHVDEIHEIKSGAFLRWVKVAESGEVSITNGAFFCEVVFTDYGTALRMKNFRNRYFEVKLDEAILFQKLSPQEKVLLAALSFLDSKNT